MIKLLTQIEKQTAGSGTDYVKLHFGKQFFTVAPWHYEVAGLQDIMQMANTVVEGKEYDIKWRAAKIKGRDVTLLTGLSVVEAAFVWAGEEQGCSEAPVKPKEVVKAPMKPVQHIVDSYELDDIPF